MLKSSYSRTLRIIYYDIKEIEFFYNNFLFTNKDYRSLTAVKSSNLLNYFFFNDLEVLEDDEDEELVQDEYTNRFLETDIFFMYYDYLNTSQFSLFFTNLSIDIPVCFQKSNSLFKLSNELTLIKLVNFFMRDGKKLRLQILVVSILIKIFQNNYYLITKNDVPLWKQFYINFTQLKYNFSYKNINLCLYDNMFSDVSKDFTRLSNVFSFFFKELMTILPIFSLYIYKVDKFIYKNTRGKSGKFTFIWKYITPYKRLFWVFHWLSKELKMQVGKKLKLRLHLLFNNVFFNKKSLFLYKIKRFSYNYIYENCKNSLQKTYKTVAK